MTPFLPGPEPRWVRLYLGLFALSAVVVVLLAGRLRFLVPVRHQARFRDVTWPGPPGR